MVPELPSPPPELSPLGGWMVEVVGQAWTASVSVAVAVVVFMFVCVFLLAFISVSAVLRA